MRTAIISLNTSTVRRDVNVLEFAGFEPKLFTGSYQHLDGTIVSESSYRVEVRTESELVRLKELAASYNQESILVLDGDNNATLVYLERYLTIDLGVFTRCTEEEAVSQPNYSYDENGDYWICVA